MKATSKRPANDTEIRRSKAAWDKLSLEAQHIYLTKYCGRCFFFKTLCKCPGTVK
jgi:hypothetical protein